jgi:hypothetical protein
MSRRIAAVGLASLALVLASPAASATNDRRAISTSRIAGMPVFSTFMDTLRRFGRAGAHERFDSAGCTLTYASLGLWLSWVPTNPLARTGTANTCVHINGIRVSGRGWRTLKGLAIGDPLRRLVRLYPQVYDTRDRGPLWAPPRSIEWNITITCCGGGERPALSASVRGGHVVALLIEIVGR